MDQQVLVVNNYLEKITNFGLEYAPKLLGGLLVLFIGLWVTKLVTKAVGKSLTKSSIDQSLVPFLKSLTNIILKALLIITVMGMIGIEMTSFVAIIGAAGLAVGLALSGTLQNFAGGVIILILKPFKIGDFVEAQGFLGTVKEINIFSTLLNTPDKKLVIIPNGPLSTGALINYSAEPLRRVDWTFGIAYGDDVENFKKAINQFISEDDRILKDPAGFIGLSELADSSVNFAVRVWVDSANYWGVFFDMNEKVYTKFPDYDLNIPFPQMDVHVQKQ
ncbi:small conductance mechanosensitive channel [Flavobacterium sp. 7E]|uniref:mechanosensitive ion channel family protein n=1 Tax=unclassified Flavobacterium TaxID=196869 RepID=UPI00156E7C36|nr:MULTISPECIES: mechanosensitive ion channel domain-containing protein [unclassified Flavobacterium]MBE0391769.1 Small-conductance mechanosensitive channel [Flavobacterium sp. PL002]NRS87116.1 small conductance mechanosensitive channel [Flavobacterium sp. 7E]NRT14156.1 small conductance mechanosensitive channel [Flavobacterium sp. 28A]